MSYGLYIGKNLTSDGHAWLAGYGDEPSSHWLEIIPKKNKTGQKITVGVTENAEMPGNLIKIPCWNFVQILGTPKNTVGEASTKLSEKVSKLSAKNTFPPVYKLPI